MLQQRRVMLTMFRQWVTHPVHLCVNSALGILPLVLSGIHCTTWRCMDVRLLLVCILRGSVSCGIVVLAGVVQQRRSSGCGRVMRGSSHVAWLVSVQSSYSSAFECVCCFYRMVVR